MRISLIVTDSVRESEKLARVSSRQPVAPSAVRVSRRPAATIRCLDMRMTLRGGPVPDIRGGLRDKPWTNPYLDPHLPGPGLLGRADQLVLQLAGVPAGNRQLMAVDEHHVAVVGHAQFGDELQLDQEGTVHADEP